jgi:methylmalonyl-CoA/ethylmalonyl-CoA epimerase
MIDCSFFGADARFHHVGLCVASIRAACPEAQVIENHTQGVAMAFVDMHGATVELLEPLGERSPIARSLREGHKLLHLCFEVDDVDVAVAACRSAGFHRISPAVIVPEYEGRRIAWVLSRQFGLVELLERRRAGVGAVR